MQHFWEVGWSEQMTITRRSSTTHHLRKESWWHCAGSVLSTTPSCNRLKQQRGLWNLAAPPAICIPHVTEVRRFPMQDHLMYSSHTCPCVPLIWWEGEHEAICSAHPVCPLQIHQGWVCEGCYQWHQDRHGGHGDEASRLVLFLKYFSAHKRDWWVVCTVCMHVYVACSCMMYDRWRSGVWPGHVHTCIYFISITGSVSDGEFSSLPTD